MTANAHLEVLTLFLIPIGGGIPAGVLLAHHRGIDWPMMMLLYLVSDVILAFLFEPILKGFVLLGRRMPALARFGEAMKLSMQRTAAYFGSSRNPLALILISFAADPMTGRAAAVAAGHGFVSGWAVAITGDMLFFAMLMVSTLWLNNVLGDGNSATIIIMAVMILIPYLVRRAREALR